MSDEGEDPSPRPKRKIKKVMVLSSASGSDSEDGQPAVSTRRKRLRVLSEDGSDSSSGSWAMGAIRRRRALPGLRDSSPDSDSSGWATDHSDAPDAAAPADTVSSPSKSATRKEKSKSGFSSDSSEGNSEKCSICLMKFLNQEVGTPQNCEHIFCLDCITEWSRNMNTCPVDRITFDSIVVRACAGGRILRTEPVKVIERRPSVEMMLIEDPTVCEVCHNADREETMLLCDGCDLGFHMQCLNPPLTRIPEDQWLCPNCSGVWRSSPIFFPMQSSQSLGTWDNRERSTYERARRDSHDDPEPSTSTGRRGRSAPASAAAPAGAGRARPGGATAGYARRTTTPRARKRKYKRRKTRTIVVEYEVQGDGKFPITKTRKLKTTVRRRKIKKRQPRTAARRTHVIASVRAKLAAVRGEGAGVGAGGAPGAGRGGELAARRAGAGIPALSLFGSAHELDYLEEEEGQGSEGASTAATAVAARPSAAVFSAYRQARRKMVSVPSPPHASAAPDLLSDILARQTLLHSKRAVVSLSRDGDLDIQLPAPAPARRPGLPTADAQPDRTPLTDKKEVDLTSGGEGARQAPAYPGQGRGWGGGYRYPRDQNTHHHNQNQHNQGYGRGGYDNGFGGRGVGGAGRGHFGERRDDGGPFNDYNNRRPHHYASDDEPWHDRNRRQHPDHNRGGHNQRHEERRFSGGGVGPPQSPQPPQPPLHRHSFGGFDNPLDMRVPAAPFEGGGVRDKPQPYRPLPQPPAFQPPVFQSDNFQSDAFRLEPAPSSFRPELASSAFRPEPAPSSFRPEPAQSSFRPEPAPSSFRPEPAPSSFRPEPAPSSFRPEPAPSSFRPEPAPSSFRPEPAPSSFRPEPAPSSFRREPETSAFEADAALPPPEREDDERSDEGLVIDTEKYDPTEPTHDEDSGEEPAPPAAPPSPPPLPSPPPPPPPPPGAPSVESILAGLEARGLGVSPAALDSAVRAALQEHRALLPRDGACPNFSIYSATSVHIANAASPPPAPRPPSRAASLEDLVQEDGDLTPPAPAPPADDYKAKLSKRCPITTSARDPIKIKLLAPSLIKRQVSLYDDEDVDQAPADSAESAAAAAPEPALEAPAASPGPPATEEEALPTDTEPEMMTSMERIEEPKDDKDGSASPPRVSDEDAATPERADEPGNDKGEDFDDDRTDEELADKDGPGSDSEDEPSTRSGSPRSPALPKMTESISETEDERSYTPCLDENKSKDASLEDKGIEGLDTEMISEEEGNDMFSEGSPPAADAPPPAAGAPAPEDGEILDGRPRSAEPKRKKKEKKEAKKEGKGKVRKRAEVAFKKLGKGKERNYRERDKNKEKRRSAASSSRERRRKDKRKDLERYDVRTLLSARRRPRKDAFGRDVSPSASRSPSAPPRRPRADPDSHRARLSPSPRRARLSPSPRRARLSPSPRRARQSLSPRRARLSPSPRRARLSPSPRRARLSPSPHRARISPSPRRARLSSSPRRARHSPSPRRARISASPRRHLSPSPRRARPTLSPSPRRSPTPKRRRKRSGSRGKAAPRRRASATRARKRRRSASPAPSPKPAKAKKKKRARSPRAASKRRKRARSAGGAPAGEGAAWSAPAPERAPSPRTPPPAEPVPMEERRRRRELERAHRRLREPAGPSKEVFTSGDNILVSVSFKEQERAERVGRRERRRERRRRRRRAALALDPAAKPVAIIDLERSPFRELTPSPKNVIVLSDDEAERASPAGAPPAPTPGAPAPPALGPKTPPDPADPPPPGPAAAPAPAAEAESRGWLTPAEAPRSPDAYDPFEPTRSASNSPPPLAAGAPAPAPTPAPPAPAPRPTPPDDDAEERPSMTLEAAQKTNLSADEVLDRRPLSPIEKVMALLQSTRDVSPEEPEPRAAGASPGAPHGAGAAPPAAGAPDAQPSTAAVPPAPRILLPEQPRPPPKLFLAKPSPIKSDPIKPMPQATKISRLPLPMVVAGVRRVSESPAGGGASPYSPGSSDFGDLFSPPPPASRRDAFDALQDRARPRPRRNGKAARNKKGKTTVGVKLDEDNLKILDELPSSAVEMQVKSKFLKKLNRQERVVEEVKLVLKPHYNKKHVSKDEYKHILRRAVPKICHNKTGEINPTKIQALVEAYVKKFRKRRKLNQ